MAPDLKKKRQILNTQQTEYSCWNFWFVKLDLEAAARLDIQEVTEEQRVALFFNQAGETVTNLFEPHILPNQTLDQTITALDLFFNPVNNVHNLVLQFRSIMWHSEEKIDSFRAKLRTASIGCEFPNISNEISQQILQECVDLRTPLKRLTMTDQHRSLINVLSICRQSKLIDSQIKADKARQTSRVNNLNSEPVLNAVASYQDYQNPPMSRHQQPFNQSSFRYVRGCIIFFTSLWVCTSEYMSKVW